MIAATLRAADVRVDVAYGDRGLKATMRAADRSGASLALIKDGRRRCQGQGPGDGEQVSVAAESVVGDVLARLGPLSVGAASS